MVPFVVELAARCATRYPEPEHEHMREVAKALGELYNVLYSSGIFLTREQHGAVIRECDKMGKHYMWLASYCTEQGARRWSMVPKLHYAVGHLPDQARLVNPVFVQGYRSESMVGKVTTI